MNKIYYLKCLFIQDDQFTFDKWLIFKTWFFRLILFQDKAENCIAKLESLGYRVGQSLIER